EGEPIGGEFRLTSQNNQTGGEMIALTGGRYVLITGTFNPAIDVVGHIVTPGQGDLVLTIDVEAPEAPSAPDLHPASDSGVSDSDDLTNDTTPTLTGTGPADTLIRIYEGATLVAEGMSDGAGA